MNTWTQLGSHTCDCNTIEQEETQFSINDNFASWFGGYAYFEFKSDNMLYYFNTDDIGLCGYTDTSYYNFTDSLLYIDWLETNNGILHGFYNYNFENI